MNSLKPHPASFRDPAGFVYKKDESIYRFVSNKYKEEFTSFITTGLYKELVAEGFIIPFEQIAENHFNDKEWFTTLKPNYIPFISYASEWCFDQLKDAALLTLKLSRRALYKGMILKDATHLNIQFLHGAPVHIDSLSFERYHEGESWAAYRQFCECFLNPLLLAVYHNMEVHKLLTAYKEGVPASITSGLLPFKTKLKPSILLHVHLQAKLGGKTNSHETKKRKLTSKDLLHIIQHLESCIQALNIKKTKSTWNNYYDETILSTNYLTAKREIVTSWLTTIHYSTAVDLGANKGEFSELLNKNASVIATDFDSNCIQSLYGSLKNNSITNILPLVIDITQPTPATGWNNEEQQSFVSRSQYDLGLALALIHHLAIGKNISLIQIAQLFSNICSKLIIEFIPKDDPKVADMLQNRKDIFEKYAIGEFENAFTTYFNVIKKEGIPHSNRTLYLMEKK